MVELNRMFVWLRDSATPRVGPRLEKGKAASVADYPPAVVSEWVRTGAATMVEVIAEVEPVIEKKHERKAAKSGGR